MIKRIVLSLIFLVFICFGLSYFTAEKFKKELTLLEERLAEEESLKIRENYRNFDFFTSEGSLLLEYDSGNNYICELDLSWQGRHWPGWLSFKAKPLFKFYDSRKALSKELFSLPPFDLRAYADWRKIKCNYRLKNLDTEFKALFNLSDLKFDASFYYSGKKEAKLKLAELSFKHSSASQSVDFKDLYISFKQSGLFPWQESSLKTDFGEFYIKNNYEAYFFKDGDISFYSKLDKNDFISKWSLSSSKLYGENFDLDDLDLHISVNHIDPQAVADLLIYSKDKNFDINSAEKEEDILFLEDKLFKILKSSPRFDLYKLKFSLNKPLKMQPHADAWLSFDYKDMPRDFIRNFKEGRIDRKDLLSKLNSELRLSGFAPLLKKYGEAFPFISEKIDVEEDIFLRLEKGELYINDQLFFGGF